MFFLVLVFLGEKNAPVKLVELNVGQKIWVFNPLSPKNILLRASRKRYPRHEGSIPGNRDTTQYLIVMEL